MYARADFDKIVHVHDSEFAERQWFTLLTESGPILLGNWYRPPDGNANQITSLHDELSVLMESHASVTLLGDMNVHLMRWLKFSSPHASTANGESLFQICKDFQLQQCVKVPTRPASGYLLDLVLTDLKKSTSIDVQAPIADHCVVICRMDLCTQISPPIKRRVWCYKTANWNGLRDAVCAYDFSFLHELDVNEAVPMFVAAVLRLAESYIPRKDIETNSRTHPWLTDRCRWAIDAKTRAFGSDEFQEEAERCRDVLVSEYRKYQAELRAKIASLSRGSKRWWSLSRELLCKTAPLSTVPPMKTAANQPWITAPEDKANLLANTFREKWRLPEVENFLPCEDLGFSEEPNVRMSEFFLVRCRWAKRCLRGIKDRKATGPDELPGRILRELACEIAPMVALIARKCVEQGVWPDCWRYHWIFPLHKKKHKWDPQNYRGIHLTCVLSKVIERLIGVTAVTFLDRTEAFGKNQWAFRPKRSCRDLTTLLICTWILSFKSKKKVGLFLSDISGAFDKVDSDILLAKCRQTGLSVKLLVFLRSFFAPRRAQVVLPGAKSAEFMFDNQVYQGTVLGPPMWNTFFSDVIPVAAFDNFIEALFADDLNTFKLFSKDVSNEYVFASLRRCQARIHAWGRKNRVTFDPTKEEFKVIHPTLGEGGIFRLLGVQVDPKLAMDAEIEKILKKVKPKITAILRVASLYSVRDLVLQYKAHVLCDFEFSTGAIFHVGKSKLHKLDAQQARFLRGIGLAASDAFMTHNLAPLCLRRDIAMLGLLHKIALGEAHPAFEKLFPLDVKLATHQTRRVVNKNRLQFVNRCDGDQTSLMNKSVFACVRVYNKLPMYCGNAASVKDFQSLLTKDARFACGICRDNWERLFSCRVGDD